MLRAALTASVSIGDVTITCSDVLISDALAGALNERTFEKHSNTPEMINDPQKLDAAKIEHNLQTRRVGRGVLCFDEVDSTNDIAWDSARQVDTDGLVILAESQRSGRGRMGRKWVTPPDSQNILMSVLLRDPQKSLPHESITIAAGLSVAEGIDDALHLDTSLKWPNDVLVDGKKLAGIIVELRNGKSENLLVIGIGINVSDSPPDSAVEKPATSLRDHTPQHMDRNEIIRCVLQRLDHWVAAISDGKLKKLHDGWRNRCGMINQWISVQSNGDCYTGRVLDVDPLDGLVLCDERGVHFHIPAAGATVL